MNSFHGWVNSSTLFVQEHVSLGLSSQLTQEQWWLRIGIELLLIDLVSLAGMYAGTAALLTVFDMQLDAGESHLLPPGG
jgi:hypothetical protein